MDAHTLSTRIDELEIRLSFQEQLISTLNEALVQQEFRLQQLQRVVDQLRDSILTGNPHSVEAGLNPSHEKPPHY